MTHTPVATVRIEAQVDRTLVPVGEAAHRWVKLVVFAPETAAEAVHPPLNLALVIDRSGSMSGAKLGYVKEAAVHALRLLGGNDRVAVVVYDDEVDVLAPGGAVAPARREEMIRLVRGVRSGSTTNLSGGWFAGCEQVAGDLHPEQVNRVLLLTDGLANVGLTDHEELAGKAKEWRRQGITVTTFGVGADFNQYLLQGIADNGGGHFYFIENPDQIPAFFQGELGEMINITARTMTLEIGLHAGMEAALTNDRPFERNGDRLVVELGDAFAGEQLTVALALDLPPAGAGQEITLPLSLHYVNPQTQGEVAIASSLHFVPAPAGACEEQPVNEAWLAELAGLMAERAKLQALALAHRGEGTASRDTLQRAIDAISALLAGDPVRAIVADLRQVMEEIAYGMDALTEKKRHYTAYQTQRSRRDYGKQ